MSIDIGGLADGFSKIGNDMLNNVQFYARSKMYLHNSGGCCRGGNIWGMGGNPYMQSAYGMDAMTLNFAYQRGAMMMREAYLNTQVQYPRSGTVHNTDNPAADPVDANQDTAAGALFEKAVKDGNNFDFAKTELAGETDSAKKQEMYKEKLQELAKSLLMHIDKASGNGDGELTLQEFLDNEMKDLDDTQKQQLRTQLQQMFSQINMNGVGKADWKELAALLRAYDSNSDGEITKEEVAAAETALASGQFFARMTAVYNNLFKSQQS